MISFDSQRRVFVSTRPVDFRTGVHGLVALVATALGGDPYIMRTRPIFHSSDAAIRGHVFCSFLALAMQKYLDDLSCEAGVAPEWKELLRDLDRLQQVRLQYRGADWLMRTDAAPTTTALFRQAHVALPPRARQTAPPKAIAPSKPARKRRGRPKRSATSLRISP